jgi:hypothetical protein
VLERRIPEQYSKAYQRLLDVSNLQSVAIEAIVLTKYNVDLLSTPALLLIYPGIPRMTPELA